MDALRRKGRALKAEIKRLEDVITAIVPTAPLTIGEVEHHLIKVRGNWMTKVDEMLDELATTAADDAEYDLEEPEFLALRERADKVELKFSEMKRTMTPPPNAAVQIAPRATMKLPELKLPFFEGEIQKWLSFHDLFRASIHNRADLSGAQKLQYLRGQLRGESATLISNIEVTDANYDEAWKVLKERYENQRMILRTIFEKLMSQPELKEENSTLLQKIADVSRECFQAIEILKIPPEKVGELLIIHLTSKKLDAETRLQWEKVLKKNDIPTFGRFVEFLDRHAQAVAASKSEIVTGKPKVQMKSAVNEMKNEKNQGRAVHHGAVQQKTRSCEQCGENHPIFRCASFHKLPIDEKWNVVMKSKLCFKCFGSEHRLESCKFSDCKTCGKAHNSALCKRKETQAKEDKKEEVTEPKAEVANHFSMKIGKGYETLLSTALIRVKDSQNKLQVCRAFLDSGSQSSFVTPSCATRLGLKKIRVEIPISGIGATNAGASRLLTKITFKSCYSEKDEFEIEALVLDKITGNLPSMKFTPGNWPHLNNIRLADPRYFEPGQIDILLGQDVFMKLLTEGLIQSQNHSPIAQNTALGWILGGEIKNDWRQQPIKSHYATCEIDATLKKFWELEEILDKPNLTEEEKQCETHFEENVQRLESGSYQVRLPLKADPKTLGNSKVSALKRFQQVARRHKLCEKQLDEKNEYREVLNEYIDLGHMQEVLESEENENKPIYYMPHHAVIKESSSTTKLRVVFDASAKTTTGVSLNDIMMTGPKLQEDLISIFIRFRLHQIALIGDIAKMYRQVSVHPDDVDLQRIMWIRPTDDKIIDYKLMTATFGTASAPYLAVKCVQKLAKDEREEFPEAAEVMQRDFYVDDMMSGAETVDDTIKLQRQLVEIFKKGGMVLRKFCSSSSEVLQLIPEELRELKSSFEINPDETIKTLGIAWKPAADCFSIIINLPIPPPKWTKRKILSEIAKIYDPLGWLSPVTIVAKMTLQHLWTLNTVGWDDPLNEEVEDRWGKYRNELPKLKSLKIPRYMSSPNSVKCELHGFCDASEAAYAAVVYLRSINENGKVRVMMIAAKTKVAPLNKKTLTLPRLELLGSSLLVKLLEIVKKSLSTIKIESITAWTDSEIVLAWLSSPPQRWKTFVANRVAEIQRFLSRNNWKHIRSKQNPADCASRGIPAQNLLDFALWWNGPSCLSSATVMPKFEFDEPNDLLEEKITIRSHVTRTDFSWLSQYSTLNRLLRITVIRQRFITRFCKKWKPNYNNEVDDEWFSINAMKRALYHWIRQVQMTEFPVEYELLMKKQKIPEKNRYAPLALFLQDEEEILRVGGRLRNANIPEDAKHQMLLPKKSHLTWLIVTHEHQKNLHAGPQLLLATLQQTYWIVGGRDVVKSVVRKCLKCFKNRAQTAQQMMGNLPEARVNPSPPFQTSGVDYAGPFMILPRTGRGQKTTKMYVAVFVCFVTKAVHLELVMDLTTEAFLATLRRFVSRRGNPSDIHSDCGTNFVGAKRIFDEHLKWIQDKENNRKLADELAKDGIKWHLNPAGAPHFGGLWEAAVKSMKFHLKRIIGTSHLTIEEMQTLLTQIEACLNSRPITELSSDPNELLPLTPGHFLIG